LIDVARTLIVTNVTRRLLPFVLLLAALPAAASVDYYLSVTSIFLPVDPGSRARVSAAVSPVCCRTNDPTDATVTIPLPPGSTNISAPGEFGGWACSVADTTVTCTTHLAASTAGPGINVDFTVPPSLDGLSFSGRATLTTTVTDDHPENNFATISVNVYRILAVTTADDFGAGSLRDTLARANAGCDVKVACKMTFAGPMTIEPTSPLPAITACGLLIDGGVSQGASLDLPRPVEISGAKAGFANGLEIRSSCGVTLRGVTINRFAANGLVLAEPKSPSGFQGVIFVESCFIGTDTAATEARPNGMRGISVETPFTYAYVNGCAISGNRYSGIAVWDSQSVSIGNCRIGVGRDGRALGNGASGVFVNGGTVAASGGPIAYNHDFGVGVGVHAAHVFAPAEYLFANGVQDLDWGLDGPTRIDPAGRMPPAPVLIDAIYDAGRNITTIRGFIPHEGLTPRGFSYLDVRLLEKSGTGYESRTSQFTNAQSVDDIPFSLTIRGDLRGHTLAAQAESYIFPDSPAMDSSELSAPVVAQ